MRKYPVGFVPAHQHLSQLDEVMLDAILGNVGAMTFFPVGLTDVLLPEKEFYPEFRTSHLVNLPNYHIYLKLMIGV